ncbi:hypothetical protein MKY41_15900 [Sporosarcina sp. FSL W7-1349]|uniref:hypothetical protein n=1 Tax=Sporosarcina sp. FSL W7-1349 TaxID=2921561 RepID=UPI0030F8DDDC
MKVKWKLALGVALCVFLLAACSSAKELSISTRSLTEKEQILVKNSGGADMEYFVINGDLPEGQTLGITLEVHEKGKLVSENEPGVFNEDFLADRNISFGIRQGWGDQNDELIFSSSGGLIGLQLAPLKGASSHGALIDEKVVLQMGEPVYLAYWITSEDLSIRGFGNAIDEEELAALKAYDRAVLLKAELRED